MDKVFEININENIEVLIDSRYKIKGFVEFIRLSFNRLDIKDNKYFIYFDSENIKKHKLLLQTLVNMYKKIYHDDTITKRLALNYRKNVEITVKKHQISEQKNILNINVKKLSSKEFVIEFGKDIKSVYEYIKGLFLFDVLDLRSDNILISFNEDTKKIVSQMVAKSSIVGYKINFNIDETEFKFTHRKYSIEGSLKEYLTKIRNALEVFGVETIYQFDAIKKEYKRLAKKYHPDLHQGKPELIQKIYSKKFLNVKESFELLEEYYKSKEGKVVV
jgi:molecular chaperone DnaJ